jgi:peptidoglycan/LPS O-acetylase OafA/YrhL
MQGGVCLALSALFPFAMYHGVEKPMIDFGRRVASSTAKASSDVFEVGTKQQVLT